MSVIHKSRAFRPWLLAYAMTVQTGQAWLAHDSCRMTVTGVTAGLPARPFMQITLNSHKQLRDSSCKIKSSTYAKTEPFLSMKPFPQILFIFIMFEWHRSSESPREGRGTIAR